jgi:hypothetical protein
VRVLFVAYCFGENAGQTLIGVYKRGLRIALELDRRGHEVLFDCTGRSEYRDELTAIAEERLRFVDLRLGLPTDDPERSRADSVRAIADCAPDLVVVGEAPLAGTLLEATLCAVELDIPVAVLDNAYNDSAAMQLIRDHGGLADGIVLTGPSCAHARAAPTFVRQIPPLVAADPDGAAALVEGLGLESDRLVSILAYDRKAERLGFSLAERLAAPNVDYLFMARRPDECERRAAELPPELGARVRVVGLLPDPLLFGVLERSSLAVVKYGFMQVSECLALRTPAVCVFHEGATWVDLLPELCQRYLHVAQGDEADPATVNAARRLLDVDEEELRAIHDGGFDGVERAADFLEELPTARRDAWTAATETFPEEEVRAALQAGVGGGHVDVRLLRAMLLRSLPGAEIHALVCRCETGGDERFLRLWARRYASPWAVRRDRRAAARSGRRVLAASPRRRILIEADPGQALLPPL